MTKKHIPKYKKNKKYKKTLKIKVGGGEAEQRVFLNFLSSNTILSNCQINFIGDTLNFDVTFTNSNGMRGGKNLILYIYNSIGQFLHIDLKIKQNYDDVQILNSLLDEIPIVDYLKHVYSTLHIGGKPAEFFPLDISSFIDKSINPEIILKLNTLCEEIIKQFIRDGKFNIYYNGLLVVDFNTRLAEESKILDDRKEAISNLIKLFTETEIRKSCTGCKETTNLKSWYMLILSLAGGELVQTFFLPFTNFYQIDQNFADNVGYFRFNDIEQQDTKEKIIHEKSASITSEEQVLDCQNPDKSDFYHYICTYQKIINREFKLPKLKYISSQTDDQLISFENPSNTILDLIQTNKCNYIKNDPSSGKINFVSYDVRYLFLTLNEPTIKTTKYKSLTNILLGIIIIKEETDLINDSINISFEYRWTINERAFGVLLDKQILTYLPFFKGIPLLSTSRVKRTMNGLLGKMSIPGIGPLSVGNWGFKARPPPPSLPPTNLLKERVSDISGYKLNSPKEVFYHEDEDLNYERPPLFQEERTSVNHNLLDLSHEVPVEPVITKRGGKTKQQYKKIKKTKRKRRNTQKYKRI